MTKNEEKKVAKRWTTKERREDIKHHIKEVGLYNLPSYRQLAEKYDCSKTMIGKDIDKIVSTFDSKELDEVFTEFLNADKKAVQELRKIIYNGTNDEKIRAIQAMLQVQRGITDLLENYSKKQKVADKLAVASVSYNFTIQKPEKNSHEDKIIKIMSDKKKKKKNE
jgi:hypothetical protein